MFKQFSLLATILYTILLAIASFIKLEDMPEVEVDFGDKIFHFIAYALLFFLWYNVFFYFFLKPHRVAILNAMIFSVVFGIIIEVLQGILTTHRSFDIYDAIANSSGTLIVAILISVYNKLKFKNN